MHHCPPDMGLVVMWCSLALGVGLVLGNLTKL
ncbi:hypothetical protein ABIC70_001014 [Methylobacterium sp. 1973]|jgi:hypothetical protein